MKNHHLIPANIIDIAAKLTDKTTRENERHNYEIRLEAIRDYCTTFLNTYSRDKQSMLSKEDRLKRLGKHS